MAIAVRVLQLRARDAGRGSSVLAGRRAPGGAELGLRCAPVRRRGVRGCAEGIVIELPGVLRRLRSDLPGRSLQHVATVPRGVAPAGAGPDELGRHVVIEPGGSIPERWADAQRIVIDGGTLTEPAHALAFLRAAHHARERLVIELAASFDREPMLMTEAAPYELGPTFAFDLEELHHLVWSNSVDHRDPARPTWIALDMAIAAGASPADGRARRQAARRHRRLARRRARATHRSDRRRAGHPRNCGRARVVAPTGCESLRRRPCAGPARSGHASRRWRPHHCAGGLRKDPGADRTGAPPADQLEPAARAR